MDTTLSLITMTTNEANAKAFADQFSPPLQPMRTMRVNGIAFPDAWQVAYWPKVGCIGITAVFYEGQCHAFLEASGPGDMSPLAGKAMATALGLIP
jgi:hypothetical protein